MTWQVSANLSAIEPETIEPSDELFKSILENSNFGLVVLDGNGRVVFWNNWLASTSGIDADKALGYELTELFPELQNSRLMVAVTAALERGQSAQLSRLLNRSPLPLYADDALERLQQTIILQPLVSDKLGCQIQIFDATPEAIREAKLIDNRTHLEETNKELKRSNEDLQQFAMIASHDLQEPLRVVQAFAGLLKSKYDDKLGEQGLDYLTRMETAAQRMETLIKDLLAFSRVTTRAKPFTPVDLGKLMGELMTDLEVQIKETGAQIDVGALPTLNADPLQMRQLFQNLVGNALKYHRQDVPPVIKIASEAKPGKDRLPGGGQGISHQITITDNGIGFRDEFAERIFAVFQRLHGRGSYSGTGVGLAICRKIVERCSGTITASGVPDHGATFTITLPEIQPTSENKQ